MTFADKWYCRHCQRIGPLKTFDEIPDPRNPGDSWYACPDCDGIDCITTACDEPGCTREGTCGFPVADERKYRRTCFEHSIFKQEQDARDAQA